NLLHTSPLHIYSLSLHDALPISLKNCSSCIWSILNNRIGCSHYYFPIIRNSLSKGHCIRSIGNKTERFESGSLGVRSMGYYKCRSEEHTSELQSRENLVCRLLLE